MKKGICFVVPRAYYLFNPKIKNIADKIGGAQKQSYLLSTGLAKNESFDMHFCVANFGQPIVEAINGVQVWKSFRFGDNALKRTKDLLKTLKKIGADVYILRAADVGVALATIFIKKILKKQVIYMLAGESEAGFDSLKQNRGIITALAMPVAYKLADKIIAQTKQQADLFSKRRKPDCIIKSIIDIKSQPASQTERKTVLWVGRLSQIKKPELFINLAKKFPSEHFTMIAPLEYGTGTYGNKIQTAAKKLNNLRHEGFINPNEINAYYKKAKLYVMTSESEGFSNTMMEAMANKCPILSYKVNPDHLFEKFKPGLCAHGEETKFYCNFEKMLYDNKLRTSFAENGYRYLLSNHNYDDIIKQFAGFLKALH